jgi:hypothetical protein
MGFRFVHTSDLHLGRRFGTFDEDVRARLIEARHGAIGRLAAAARDHGAADVVIAGDMFDTETVTPRVWRQALAAMAAASGVTWWVLPGNHDSLSAEPLWDAVRHHAPENLRFLDAAVPVAIAPDVHLLPAPVTHRNTGVDTTAWMAAAATPDGSMRLGLAHGGVQSFGSEDDRSEVIPPDRAETAGLSYLALGDWHGTVEVSPRCWYSGTPERDAFKHGGRGACLAVTLPGAAARPEVVPVPVGEFDWAVPEILLTPELDPLAALDAALPGAGIARRDMLVRLRLAGRVRLPARAALMAAIDVVRPQFWHFETDDAMLASDVQAGDLDDLAESGALRLAAETLHKAAADAALTELDRRVASSALDRLYAILREDTP